MVYGYPFIPDGRSGMKFLKELDGALFLCGMFELHVTLRDTLLYT